MKNTITSFACFCMLAVIFILSAGSKAYSQDEPQYLLDMKKVKVSGFGNTNHGFSMIDGNFAYSSGGSGAFLFDYKYFVGIYSQALETNHLREDIYSSTYDPSVDPSELPIFTNNNLYFNHGGLWLGYIHKPNSLIHWGTNMKLGVGNVSLRDKSLDGLDEHHQDFIATVIPEIDVELNIARWFKINMGIGYRFVLFTDNTVYRNAVGQDILLFKSSQLSSPTATIKLMFGIFGPRASMRNGADFD